MLGQHGLDLGADGTHVGEPCQPSRSITTRGDSPDAKTVASTAFAFAAETLPAFADQLGQARRTQRDPIGPQALGGVLVQQPAQLARDPVRGDLRRDAGGDHVIEVRGERRVRRQHARVIGRQPERIGVARSSLCRELGQRRPRSATQAADGRSGGRSGSGK